MRRINPERVKVAKELGLKRFKLPIGILRPMPEEARQVIINRIKRVNQPHNDPILDKRTMRPPIIGVTETEDSISITIPKRPVERLTKEQAVEILAIRRAGGKAS